MRPPDFWQHNGFWPHILSPLGYGFGRLSMRRIEQATPWQAPIPIICVGNLTVGGAGKTPTVLALTELLKKAGHRPAILSRGYRGALKGPIKVDLEYHNASDVGDEALLLAKSAPTFIARRRADGAKLAIEQQASILILDDGLQHTSLAQNLRLLVIDGGAGLGNRRPLPAGPLREPLAFGIARVNAALIIGDDKVDITSLLPPTLPHFTARLIPTETRAWKGLRCIAFAGIGRPQKFFTSLASAGANIVAAESFADHHVYNASEIAALVNRAAKLEATLVTTRKDAVRLGHTAPSGLAVFDVTLKFEQPDAFAHWLLPRLNINP